MLVENQHLSKRLTKRNEVPKMVYVDEPGLRENEKAMQHTRGKWAKHPWCRMTADTAAELIGAILESRITATFVMEDGAVFVTVIGLPACDRVVELGATLTTKGIVRRVGRKLAAEIAATGG